MQAASSFPQYLNLRELVERGRYEQASQGLRELRDSGSGVEQHLRALIATRIAVKSSGGRSVDHTWLDPARASDAFLEAETRFTRGIVLFHENSFADGAREFERARELYLSLGDRERALMAGYNAYAGKVDASSAKARAESLDRLRPLEREAFELRNRKLLGLILREKSEVLQTLGRYAAAYEDALQAMRLLEVYGSKSDYDLAIVQAADCAVDMGRKHEARAIEQRVLDPVDRRVEFPRAMLRARISGEQVHPKDFSSVVPVTQLKWQTQFGSKPQTRAPEGTWNLVTGEVLRPGSKRGPSVKPNSLEGKLLKNLRAGKATKAALCEALWPEHCDVQLLDNRLHRLVSRLNKKVATLVQFDGERYQLAYPLVAREDA